MQAATQPVTWVTHDGARVRTEIFTNDALYRAEQERIFLRAWLLLGHESQLAQPHSFFRTRMGEESVVVTRDETGALHAWVNLCRHRGFEVVQQDHGVCKRFQCPYHGWTYASDGSLVGVPGLKQLYYDELDRDAHGMHPVPRLETYKGLIFGSFDVDAPDLTTYLGRMAWYLDILLDRRAGGTELIGVQRWRVAANWKVVCENHSGDEYHIGFAHGSFFPPDVPNRAAPLEFAREIRPEVGHGLGVTIYPEAMPREQRALAMSLGNPTVADYLVCIDDEVVERLGAQRARMHPIHGCVWPTFCMVPVFNSLRVIHPLGPREVELWSYCLVDRDAPDGVKQAYRAIATSTFGPAGSFEQDDANNWAAITRNAARPFSQRTYLNLDMGLGHEEQLPGVPGEAGLTASEINQRGFYRRWSNEMFGDE